MNPEANGAAPVPMQAGAPATENVDRIREILFGSQMREYGQRFLNLEERLLRETSELKMEVRRRMDALEAYTRQEFEALSDRLRTERSERTESVNRVAREAGDANRELESRLAKTDEQTTRDLRDVRQLILDRQRALSDELTQCVSRSELLQSRRLEELRGNAVDRVALASLLGEVAMRVRGESLSAGVEETLSAGAGR
jgi:hypothetical protein